MDTPHNRGSPRLQFSKEELEDNALSKPIAKAQKAADKADAAREKLKKRYRLKLTKEEEVSQSSVQGIANESAETEPNIKTDPKAPGVRNTRQKPATIDKKPSGKPERINAVKGLESPAEGGTKKKVLRLKFEETQGKKPSRLSHPVKKTVKNAGDQLHRQAARANEDDNAATDAALKGDDVRKSVLQAGDHARHAVSEHRYSRVQKAEKKLDRANIRFLEAKRQQENPRFTSNPLSRWQQKRAVRREYAAIKAGKGKQAYSTAKNAKQAVEKTRKASAKVVGAVSRHPAALLALALGAFFLVAASSMQSWIPLAQSLLDSVAIGTYPASEADVLAAERVYLEKEQALQDEMEHYLDYHPEVDEATVDADRIWHDPYVLIAIISACFDGQEWTIETAMPVIETYFNLQYNVTTNTVTETRTRIETLTGTRTVIDPYTGRQVTETYTYEAEVPYTYTACDVYLENLNLSHLPAEYMDHHTLSMFALYMSAHGNMEGIFTGPNAEPLKDPMLYDIPQETLDADPVFAKLMEEANKYVGYPYIWGGSDPETSFDCSGFVCWVYTSTGICRTGRLGTKGLRELFREIPDEEARPGDIVFFDGTMGPGVEGVTHCGIYVGNNMMIHCGSPIGYADLNDPYWRSHFHSFGRVPN